MTKTLTEQWREGKLPEDTYYVRFICGRYGVYEFEQLKGFGFDNDVAYIKEVLAPVPSYDEYKELVSKTDKLEKMALYYTPEEWSTMMRMVERLQEQLNEANKLLIDFCSENECRFDHNGYCQEHDSCEGEYKCIQKDLKQYLEKWGVK